MRRILYMATLALLCACGQQADVRQMADSLLGTPAQSTETMSIYESLTDEQMFKQAASLKERIDKELGIVPVVNPQSRRSTGDVCEDYTWESPERFVSLYINFSKKSIEVIDRIK